MQKSDYYTTAFLGSMRQTTDPLADRLIKNTFGDDDKKIKLRQSINQLTSNKNLTALQGSEPLYMAANRLPEWANETQMSKGAAFFAKNAEVIMNLLALLSLPYCYAAADGARVLSLSERIKNNPEQRLTDTAQFIWDIMDPAAFTAKGKAFASILKVRLTHASIRYYTEKSGKWDILWGKPVNQEDMAGTNLSFSLIVIRGMRKLGYTVDYDDQTAFMHLWNVVGHLSGVDKRLLPDTGKEATLLEKAIRSRHFKSSDHGRDLTASLINYIASVDAGQNVPKKLITQFMRSLLGDEISAILDIPGTPLPPSVYYPLKFTNFVKGLRPSSTNDFYKQSGKFIKMQQKMNERKQSNSFALPAGLQN